MSNAPSPFTDDQRARMTALNRELTARAPTVPTWVVRAYVIAAVTRQDLAQACAVAHFGGGLETLGPGGKACARAWSQTLIAAHAAGEAARGEAARGAAAQGIAA